MLKKERQEIILEKLNRDRTVRVKDISEELNTSDDTIRRDLDEMESLGFLTKVHGGAIARSEFSLRITDRLTEDTSTKQRIAGKIVSRFKEGDTILLNGGTSTLEVAKSLPDGKEFTVFTNSFPIANELFNKPKVHVHFLGGEVYSNGQLTMGMDVIRRLMEISVDWAIIGVSDVHPEKGIFAMLSDAAAIARCMFERSSRRVVLASSDKLDTARTYRIVGLDEIDYLVTDEKGREHILKDWPEGRYEVL